MTRTTHVGPIIFSNYWARRQLVENGEVVTARASDRTTGETWWRESRTGEKKGDVVVEKIATAESAVGAGQLCSEYYDVAGFESAEQWSTAIRDVHGEDPYPLHFYRVEVRE